MVVGAVMIGELVTPVGGMYTESLAPGTAFCAQFAASAQSPLVAPVHSNPPTVQPVIVAGGTSRTKPPCVAGVAFVTFTTSAPPVTPSGSSARR